MYGEYPLTMQSLVGHRLPKFSPAESELLKGSFDFLGINYYTSNYATTSTSKVNNKELSWTVDGRLNLTSKLQKLINYARSYHEYLLSNIGPSFLASNQMNYCFCDHSGERRDQHWWTGIIMPFDTTNHTFFLKKFIWYFEVDNAEMYGVL